MNKKADVISLKKVIYNIRHFFWIIIITILIAIIAIFIQVSDDNDLSSTFTSTSVVRITMPTINGVDPLIVEAGKLVDEFNVLLSSDGEISELNSDLEKQGYSSFSSEDLPEFTVTNNIAVIKIKGAEEARTNYISKRILDEFEEYISSMDKEIVYEILDSSVTVETDNKSLLDKILTMKNFFILCLGGIFGFAIVCFLIFIDDGIYVEEDFVFSGDIPYLCQIKHKKIKSIQNAKTIIKHYHNKNDEEIVCITARKSKELSHVLDKEYIMGMDEPEALSKLDNQKSKAILLIIVGRDKKRTIEEIVSLLNSLEKQILGFILVELN